MSVEKGPGTRVRNWTGPCIGCRDAHPDVLFRVVTLIPQLPGVLVADSSQWNPASGISLGLRKMPCLRLCPLLMGSPPAKTDWYNGINLSIWGILEGPFQMHRSPWDLPRPLQHVLHCSSSSSSSSSSSPSVQSCFLYSLLGVLNSLLQ